MSRFRLVLVAALVSLGLPVLVLDQGALAKPSTPRYYAVDIRAHQFNMCDSACLANSGTPMYWVLWFNNSSDQFGAPWAISLNEVCGSSLDYLTTAIPSKTPTFIQTKVATGCPGSDDRFGNLVLTSGTKLSQLKYYFGNQITDPCTFSTLLECRGMICAKFTSYAGNLTDCSAHLDNASTNLAEKQANEYIYVANANFSNGKFLSGDFNLKPNEVPGVFNSQYFQAPANMNTYRSDAPSKQFDYVWHDRAHSDHDVPPGNRHCDFDYSDHCYTFVKIA